MRKLLLLLFIGITIGCSKEEIEEECELTVFSAGSTGPEYERVYTVRYTDSEGNSTEVEVDQETYNYYRPRVMSGDENICWEGMK